GLLVRTDQPLEPGTPVVMDLVRPGMKKLLKLSGRVVGRVEKVPNSPSIVPGLRVQFDPMPDETTERLIQLPRGLGVSPGGPGGAVVAAGAVAAAALGAKDPAARAAHAAAGAQDDARGVAAGHAGHRAARRLEHATSEADHRAADRGAERDLRHAVPPGGH